MNPVYWLIEIAATMTENIIALSAVTTASKRRFEGRHHLFSIWGLAALMTVMVSLLNAYQVFSFLTIIVCMAYVILSTKLTSKGTILTRSTACVIIYFIIHTIDYVLIFSIGLLTESSATAYHNFSLLISPGPVRVLFIIVNKAIDITVYFLTRRIFNKLSTLNHKYQGILFFISLATYFVMSFLLNAILQVFILSAQMIAVVLWLFICLCLFLVIAVLFIFNSYQEEKRTNKLFQTANAMMAENYQQIHVTQQAHAQQLHDFRHHLMTVKSLSLSGKQEELSAYINELLETFHPGEMVCHSGNSIIDAIINCKAAEATQLGIQFHFIVDFHTQTNISSVDLCGILANQIDNAFDACKLIPPSDVREVIVKIRQKNGFAFFNVENTVQRNPFEDNPKLKSTKDDPSAPHGLGLKSISSIAEKYNGSLRNEYSDGRFHSVVSLCYELPNSIDKSVQA